VTEKTPSTRRKNCTGATFPNTDAKLIALGPNWGLCSENWRLVVANYNLSGNSRLCNQSKHNLAEYVSAYTQGSEKHPHHRFRQRNRKSGTCFTAIL